jgi:pullulanase
VDYNGSPAGYNADPQEHIVYVEAHDNQTLFDIGQYKHPLDTSMADRVRAQNVGMDLTVLAQGVPFLHAGIDMLRSKSMDRDSFDSGDWFNRLDFTYESNNWGVGLPVASKNEANWPLIGPRLADPALTPARADITGAVEHLREMLEIRRSSPLFRLQTAELVQERLAFHNTGPDQIPGLVVMTLADPGASPLPSGDLDPGADGLVVLFNPTDDPVTFTLPSTVGADIALHPVQASSADTVVAGATFEPTSGTFEVPARTTAVFVDVQDLVPPTVTATLTPVRGGQRQGTFVVELTCVDPAPTGVGGAVVVSGDVNGEPVADGDTVQLVLSPGPERVHRVPGTGVLSIMAPSFTMTATCTDAAGNTTVVTVTPTFGAPPPAR